MIARDQDVDEEAWHTTDPVPDDWTEFDCEMDPNHPGDRLTGWHSPGTKATCVGDLVGILHDL